MTGKEKCYKMKKLREQIAREHGIEGFEFKECDFKGECNGYCPACDAEALELRNKIKNIKKIDVSELPSDILTGKIIEPNSEQHEKTLPPDAVGGLTCFSSDDKIIRLTGDVTFEYMETFEDKKTKKKLRGIFKRRDKK